MSEPQQPNQPEQPQPVGPSPPGPPPQQPPPTQAVQPGRQKRFALVLILPAVLAAVVALVVGIGIGAWGGGGWGDSGGVGRTTAAPAPAVTVTETVTAPVEGSGAPTREPTEVPATEPTKAAYNPKPKDFKIGIKILKKTCSGGLGCDVDFQIVPSYVGGQSFPAEGTTEVTYEVTGGRDLITNTFEVDGEGTVTFDEEESAEIASSSTELVAKAIRVTYNRFG
jgi:hypothetical protein